MPSGPLFTDPLTVSSGTTPGARSIFQFVERKGEVHLLIADPYDGEVYLPYNHLVRLLLRLAWTLDPAADHPESLDKLGPLSLDSPSSASTRV